MPGVGDQRKWRRFSVLRRVSSGDLMYSMMTIANYTVMNVGNLLRVDFTHSHHIYTKVTVKRNDILMC